MTDRNILHVINELIQEFSINPGKWWIEEGVKSFICVKCGKISDKYVINDAIYSIDGDDQHDNLVRYLSEVLSTAIQNYVEVTIKVKGCCKVWVFWDERLIFLQIKSSQGGVEWTTKRLFEGLPKASDSKSLNSEAEQNCALVVRLKMISEFNSTRLGRINIDFDDQQISIYSMSLRVECGKLIVLGFDDTHALPSDWDSYRQNLLKIITYIDEFLAWVPAPPTAHIQEKSVNETLSLEIDLA